MIYEYAVEPELVATWVDRRTGRYFIESFGLGQPRVVARYPKRWRKLAWDAYTGAGDIERARYDALLGRLCEAMANRRNASWNPELAWVSNAAEEHSRAPFHAILARGNPRGLASVLVADDVDESNALWGVPRGRTVSREAHRIAAEVTGMLRAAETIVLVDPHFAPTRQRNLDVLKALLSAALGGRVDGRPLSIEVLLSVESSGGRSFEFFRDECARRVPRYVPSRLRVGLQRLLARQGGEQLHNRYILTELGGVEFGVGLDEGEAGDTDDVTLLDRDQYRVRWRQYVEDPAAFDRTEPRVIVDGVA